MVTTLPTSWTSTATEMESLIVWKTQMTMESLMALKELLILMAMVLKTSLTMIVTATVYQILTKGPLTQMAMVTTMTLTRSQRTQLNGLTPTRTVSETTWTATMTRTAFQMWLTCSH